MWCSVTPGHSWTKCITATCDLPVTNIHQAGSMIFTHWTSHFKIEFKYLYVFDVLFGKFNPMLAREAHLKRQHRSNLENIKWDVPSYMITSLCCLHLKRSPSLHCTVLWLIYSQDTSTKWKPSCGIIFSAKNSIEIDFTSTESLKTMFFHLSRLLMRMIDRSGHPNEKHIVKLKHCSLTKNGCYTRCRNTWDAILMQQDSSLPLIWLRNSHWKTIDDRDFLSSKMTVASSSALSETTSTSFLRIFSFLPLGKSPKSWYCLGLNDRRENTLKSLNTIASQEDRQTKDQFFCCFWD